MNQKNGLNRQILGLAIPNILTNLSVPLLSSVDTFLMGQFSPVHLNAVGIGAMIFNFLYWNFGFLRMGTVGITAQAYGANDKAEMIHTIGRSLLLAGLVATFLLVFQSPIKVGMLYLMQTTPSVYPLVEQYYNIRIWAAPATLGLYGVFGFYFGMQNVTIPLILTILVNVANIVLSYVFIYQFGVDVEGVAWSTVIAQYLGLFVGLLVLAQKYTYLLAAFQQKVLFQLEPMKAFFQINRDIFIRTLSLSSTFFFFYSQSSQNGELALAANVVLLQFLNWMSFGVDGFAYATESLVGKSKGAKDFQSLKGIIRYSFYWGMGLAVVYSFAYWVFGASILAVFTDNNQDVVSFATPLLFWVIILPIIGTPSYIWDGVFVGLTASHAMRNTMLIAFAIFLLTYYLAAPVLGIHALWAALMVFLAIRGVGQAWLFWKYGKELK